MDKQDDRRRMVSIPDELLRLSGSDVGDMGLGLLPVGPVELTIAWRPQGQTIDVPACEGTPCPVCLACAACGDFHGLGAACTDATCPRQRDSLR